MSTDTPTPRVDAMANAPHSHHMVICLARQLERENAELRGKLEALADWWTNEANMMLAGSPIRITIKGNAAQLRAILNEGQKP